MNKFPFEIYHLIFDYLDPYDIFNGFLTLNRYIDEIIYSYNRLKLDFQLMSKWKFRFICDRLQGCQIQSLTLSNAMTSPGQIDLFFSMFTFHQFVFLQRLDLDEIFDSNFLCLIISHLEHHPHLQSISIKTTSMSINKRNSRQLMEVLVSLPKLRILKYFQSSSFVDLRHPLIHLQYLTLYSCQLNHLRLIFPFVPNLIFLEANVRYHLNDHLETPSDDLPLKSLILRCEQWTRFVDLEHFLCRCPSIRSLIIETMGDVVLLDGNQWQRLIENNLQQLKRIELNLSVEENPLNGNDVLLPFQNSFWIESKHSKFVCLISSTSETCVRLLTVPYFNPKETWYPSSQGFHYFSIDSYPIERNCTTLRISHYPPFNSNSFIFSNIEILSLDSSFDQIDQIKSILHLSSVKHLKLSKSTNGQSLLDLLRHPSQIHQLNIHRQTLNQLIDLISNEHFPQIQILHIEDSGPIVRFDRLSKILSHLERIHLFIKERDEILQIMENFLQLKSVNFRWLHKDQSTAVISRLWLENHQIFIDEYSILNNYQFDVWIDSCEK